MGTTSSREEVKDDSSDNGKTSSIGAGGDGSSTSSSTSRSNNKICEYCDATKHQKELPQKTTKDDDDDGTSCDVYYSTVDACMKRHNGQISKCQNEWNEFRDCFNTKQQANKST